jgi:endonuclease/exonuclease/phosphatase family metal-dependent hydrolase
MATFSLLTLNCFGVPTGKTRPRLLTLARLLNQADMTAVCLQEVQRHAYRHLLTQACTAYPHSAAWPCCHAPMGGLLTLGRVPFAQSHYTRYRERGRWYTLAIMDWLLHKGVLHTIMYVHGLPIIVLNTHLNANYSGDWRPSNAFARVEQQQLRQLAELVADQPRAALVIVAGDFNIPRGSTLYHEFLHASGLTDPLADDARPTYRVLPGLPGRYALPLDLALFRAPALPGLQVDADIVFCEKQLLIDGSQRYLSDHCGIELHVTWET